MPLPKSWSTTVRFAVLHVIALACTSSRCRIRTPGSFSDHFVVLLVRKHILWWRITACSESHLMYAWLLKIRWTSRPETVRSGGS